MARITWPSVLDQTAKISQLRDYGVAVCRLQLISLAGHRNPWVSREPPASSCLHQTFKNLSRICQESVKNPYSSSCISGNPWNLLASSRIPKNPKESPRIFESRQESLFILMHLWESLESFSIFENPQKSSRISIDPQASLRIPGIF